MRRISLIVAAWAPPWPRRRGRRARRARRRSRSCRTTACCSSRAPGTRDATLDEMRSLGADSVRVFVYWNAVAPEATSTQRPPGFDAADPAAYPSDLWDRYDGARARRRAPRAERDPHPHQPHPRLGLAVRRLGGQRGRRASPTRRSSAASCARWAPATPAATPTRTRAAPLPRVGRWGLWNEPDVGRWLTPQFVRRGGRIVPASPARYRRLARRGDRRRCAPPGTPRDQILLGETAPIGNTTGAITTRPVATATFWRNLLCIDRIGPRPAGPRGRRAGVHAPAAAARHGDRPPSLHPRRQPLSPDAGPARRDHDRQPAAAPGASSPRARGAAASPPACPSTTPSTDSRRTRPTATLGVPLAKQAEYLNESDWMTYRQPAVKGLAQYLLARRQRHQRLPVRPRSSPTDVRSPATLPTAFRCGSCARG